MPEIKKETWYKTWTAKIGLAIAVVSLLSGLGYNVRASMPVSQDAVAEMIEPVKLSVADLTLMVQSNDEWIKMQRWNHLLALQAQRPLSSVEQRELCILAAHFGFTAAGCA